MAGLVFRNYNGIFQLRLENASDLEAIHQLEEAAWQATSAPLEQYFCDRKFLELVDTDANGRIRVNELKAAHLWLKAQLKDLEDIGARGEVLKLAKLTDANIRSLGDRIVRERGGDASTISLADVRSFRDAYAKKFPNGDGAVTPAQITEADLKVLAEKIVATSSGPDLSGEPGVRASDIEAFVALAKARIAWVTEGTPRLPGLTSELEARGLQLPALADLVAGLRAKVEQFFQQCELLALEPNAQARLVATPEALAALDVRDAGAVKAWVDASPLAKVNAAGVIELADYLNPNHAAALKALDAALVQLEPTREGGRITRADWGQAQAAVQAFVDWRSKEPKGLPAELDVPALQAILDGAGIGRLQALVAQDQGASAELVGLGDLEKLVLYQRWLLDLANNFVSFPNLFNPDGRALFETGTLILDGRTLSLTVLVTNRADHKKVAESSRMFVVYAELVRNDGATLHTQEIAAAVTSGTRGGIAVGKRGVFYDRDGNEWDARVVDLIAAPISLYEAAVAPFVRLREFIAARIEKMTAGKLESMESSATASTDKGLDTAATKAATIPVVAAAPAPAPAPAPAGMGNMLMGGGIAFAAVGSTMAFVVKTLADIDLVDALLAIGGVVAGIALLSGVLGWMRLKKRDLATLLEACGWALNRRMFLTRRLSLLFTQEADLPEGAQTEKPRITSPAIEAAERRLRRKNWRYVFRIFWIVVLILGFTYREPLWALFSERVLGRAPPPVEAPAVPAAPAAPVVPAGG